MFVHIELVAIPLVAVVLIIKFKNKEEIRYVQVEFLFCMITGTFYDHIGVFSMCIMCLDFDCY